MKASRRFPAVVTGATALAVGALGLAGPTGASTEAVAAGSCPAAYAGSSASVPRGPASSLTSPKQIEALAALGYVWASAPAFAYRFFRYNALHTAPVNKLGGKGNVPAAWNNDATYAGDASVLYVNSVLDLSGRPYPGGNGGTRELVLTVPPSASDYYVTNLLDSFINSTGSIGMRTTPSSSAQTYLVAGPRSKYAGKRSVTIKGFTYRVLTQDTEIGWILIRVKANSLAAPSDPNSTNSKYDSVVTKFALNRLSDFQANGNQPKYEPIVYTPSASQEKRAQIWNQVPTRAETFFFQAGRSLRLSPLPERDTGIGNTPISQLPPWVVPQAGAKLRYQNPSFGQAGQLRLFKPLGLTASGYRVPCNWGKAQLNALQAGYEKGTDKIANLQSTLDTTAATNYWTFLNKDVGTYPNSQVGYVLRAGVVQAGASANVPLDATYGQINNINGTTATNLVGDNTYTFTFTPPVAGGALPASGTIPPLVTGASGLPNGFWSLNVYTPDPSESTSPFISQASVLNLAYSSANQEARSVDAEGDTITVGMPTWGLAPAAGTAIFFGEGASSRGLQANVPYYVASAPTVAGSGASATYTFKVSRYWQQPISPGNVPIQGPTGTPKDVVDLQGGAAKLNWGPIQPVNQLGSQQLDAGALKPNADGSITIWLAPTLPSGAPATNWIPTPSAAYYQEVYGRALNTRIRPMIRLYNPTPGSDTEPSFLPPPNRSSKSTWLPPSVQQVNP